MSGVRFIAGAASVLVVLAAAVGGYALGDGDLSSDHEARLARADAVARAERNALDGGRADGLERGRQAGERKGRRAGVRAGTAAGLAAGEVAAQEKANAIAAEAEPEPVPEPVAPAIPTRCLGIPTNTTAYTMCINAPGFPDSP